MYAVSESSSVNPPPLDTPWDYRAGFPTMGWKLIAREAHGSDSQSFLPKPFGRSYETQNQRGEVVLGPMEAERLAFSLYLFLGQ